MQIRGTVRNTVFQIDKITVFRMNEYKKKKNKIKCDQMLRKGNDLFFPMGSVLKFSFTAHLFTLKVFILLRNGISINRFNIQYI